MSTTLIKNGTLLDENGAIHGDLFIENGKIKHLGPNLNHPADHIIDATSHYVFPGGIDAHTHMELPIGDDEFSSDDFSTGTRAAIAGGTTTIIDFANQSKGDSLLKTLEIWHQKAQGKCHCDYSFHISVTDLSERAKQELKILIEQDGITSFKTFMAYEHLMLSDQHLTELMREVKNLGALITTHAEEGKLIIDLISEFRKKEHLTPIYHYLSHPAIAEEKAISRLISFTEQIGCPTYIVHMSEKNGATLVTKARRRNVPIMGETCPQYLVLDHHLYQNEFINAARYVMSPPFRSEEDRTQLWQTIANNDIQVVATDHCPFTLRQKSRGRNDFSRIPNGGPGVENRIELLFSEGVVKNKISLEQFVKLVSTNPAKVFGLYPQKGSLKIGADADIVIFDPQREHIISNETQHMNCDFSLYEGKKVTGQVLTTILRGKIAYQNNTIFSTAGSGQFLKRDRGMVL